MIPIRQTDDGFTLPVRVTPRGGRNAIEPWQDGDTAIKIRVTATPEDGKANQAVIQLLAKALDMPKKDVELIQGATSRDKVFRVKSMDVEARL